SFQEGSPKEPRCPWTAWALRRVGVTTDSTDSREYREPCRDSERYTSRRPLSDKDKHAVRRGRKATGQEMNLTDGLPKKRICGTGWIIVRTSAADSTLPPPGTRITGAYAGPALPKIVVGAGVGGALRTTSGAHHFRFIGIEFAPTPGAFVYSLIELGAGETSAA